MIVCLEVMISKQKEMSGNSGNRINWALPQGGTQFFQNEVWLLLRRRLKRASLSAADARMEDR